MDTTREKLAKIYSEPVIQLPDEAWAGVDKTLEKMDWGAFWEGEHTDPRGKPAIAALEKEAEEIRKDLRRVSRAKGLI